MAVLEAIAVLAFVLSIGIVTLIVIDRRRQNNERQQHQRPQQQQQQQQGNVPYQPPHDNNYDVHNWIPMEPFPDQPDNFPHDLPAQNRNDLIPDDLDIISLDGTISPPRVRSPEGSLHRQRHRHRENQRPPSSITSGSSTSSLCCGICMDRLSGGRIQEIGVQTTMCGHLYCRDCLFQWVDGHGNCPTCKRPTSREQLHPIYFNF